jgi:hypothetical protein
MYIVGDLVFYGRVLGKEDMSGNLCHIFRLSWVYFADLETYWEWWCCAKREECVVLYRNKRIATKPKTKPDVKLGMKDLLWFTFISLNQCIAPLLHCLIGI